MKARTFVIGDIHGGLVELQALLERLPALQKSDTVVFIGDYVDRGVDSRGVVERVRQLERECPAKVVTLKGNHEDLWVGCMQEPNLGFLLQRGNGCAETYRSFQRLPPLDGTEPLSMDELPLILDVRSWLPEEVATWMAALPLWYEDDHARYVHAGVEGAGRDWKHPQDCTAKALMWSRDEAFFKGYRGKRLVFGHTRAADLPQDRLGRLRQFFEGTRGVWTRGDLVGIDTGCGCGGHLSAIELPAMRVYDSR